MMLRSRGPVCIFSFLLLPFFLVPLLFLVITFIVSHIENVQVIQHAWSFRGGHRGWSSLAFKFCSRPSKRFFVEHYWRAKRDFASTYPTSPTCLASRAVTFVMEMTTKTEETSCQWVSEEFSSAALSNISILECYKRFLLELAQNFIWFPHMWRHNHAHEHNLTYMEATMTQNYMFAQVAAVVWA